MFRNYLITAWRNLLRNKAFSFINIFGLALGLACSLLILLWVQDERQIDAFHAASPHLYQVYERVFSEGKVDAATATPGLLARELKRKIPGIKYASGYWQRDGPETVFAVGEKRISGTATFADIVRLIVIAAAVAGPVAWMVMESWLRNYAYRIGLPLWIFVLSGVVALLIALLTISYQAIKSAMANPVKGLRAE